MVEQCDVRRVRLCIVHIKDMMAATGVLLTLLLACSMWLVDAGNFTVTDEAWFKVSAADLNGPGKNYTGQFVIALFGETVPMTVMNFVAITRGYERPGQVRRTLTRQPNPIATIACTVCAVITFRCNQYRYLNECTHTRLNSGIGCNGK